MSRTYPAGAGLSGGTGVSTTPTMVLSAVEVGTDVSTEGGAARTCLCALSFGTQLTTWTCFSTDTAVATVIADVYTHIVADDLMCWTIEDAFSTLA